jgi:hypothetical protein
LLRWIRIIAVLGVLLGGCGVPQAPTPLLNSERIEQTFGSYGIDVVYSDKRLRLSNLYSLEDGGKITRTFAIVGLTETIDDAFAAEHEAILDGGSIGATFKAAGWDVIKTRHQIYGTTVWNDLIPLMDVAAGTLLATHAYELEVSRKDERFNYATIIEMHHPDYLSQADLRSLYGPAPPVAESERRRIRALQFSGYEKLKALDSALSQ